MKHIILACLAFRYVFLRIVLCRSVIIINLHLDKDINLATSRLMCLVVWGQWW